MLHLSSRQYAMLQRLPDLFGMRTARKLNQTTLGSFARRGYVQKTGKKFHVTDEGVEALAQFGREEIYRKIVSDSISVHFRDTLRNVRMMGKRSA